VKTYEKQEFAGWIDRDSGRTFQDVEFRRCSFLGCSISATTDPALRSTFRNVRLIDCEQRASGVGAPILENIDVIGLKTHQLLILFGAVFRHVRLAGKIGELLINPHVPPGIAEPHEERAFARANMEFYRSVDWALDISEAEFVDCDLRCIPPHLVRRDPRTLVVVKREKLLDGRWRNLDLQGTHWEAALDWYLKDCGESGIVLIAGKRNRRFKRLVDGQKLLRDEGIAEPD
jgi:hypothetical protein